MTQITFNTKTFRSSIVRPADTTTYAAEDLMSSATSGVFILGAAFDVDSHLDQTTDPVFQQTDAHALSLNNLVLTLGNNSTLSLDGELWFFTVNPATRTDNAAKSFTLAEMRDSFITRVDFFQGQWRVSNSGSAAAGIKTLVIPNIDWPEQSPAFDATYKGIIYVAMVAKNAYVPVSGEVMALKATFTCD